MDAGDLIERAWSRGDLRANRARFGILSVAACLALATSQLAAPTALAACPDTIDAGKFASASRIRSLNKVMADAGERPTASPAHHRYIRWLETQLKRIPGIKVRLRYERINRWLERDARLAVIAGASRRSVRVSGAVPYSRPGTARGRLVYIPPGTAISASNVKGTIACGTRCPDPARKRSSLRSPTTFTTRISRSTTPGTTNATSPATPSV